jgi:hypothetical protein
MTIGRFLVNSAPHNRVILTFSADSIEMETARPLL